MKATYSYRIFKDAAALPDGWEKVARPNIFLSRAFLLAMQKAAPSNMECLFIGLFYEESLCGVALVQYINLAGIETFKNEARTFCIKDYLFRRFSSHVLILGNNNLTGQNAYVLSDRIAEKDALPLFAAALDEIKTQYRKRRICINLIAVKDFNAAEFPGFDDAGFPGYHKFCTQPNMIFTVRDNWTTPEDYLADMNTKYRTQYNRARKKADGIVKKRLTTDEIRESSKRISELYHTVANRASFNTFFLPENHFLVLKEELQDDFLLYGYFLDGQMVGFNTLIRNGEDMDTYFLGYDEAVQKEKMLYLNMLYDMVSYGISKGARHIVFARSAMEIKSSIGAVAEPVYGIIKHTNAAINRYTGQLFEYFDPKVEWKERNPFKQEHAVQL